MKSSFPSTDGASQVMCSEGAADVCIPASAYLDDLSLVAKMLERRLCPSESSSKTICRSFRADGTRFQYPGFRFASCVFSETYMTGRLLVGADLRAARGEWGASVNR